MQIRARISFNCNTFEARSDGVDMSLFLADHRIPSWLKENPYVLPNYSLSLSIGCYPRVFRWTRLECHRSESHL